MRPYLSTRVRASALPFPVVANDVTFRSVERSKAIPLFDLKGSPLTEWRARPLRNPPPLFIKALPEPQMPDVNLTMRMARWQLILAVGLGEQREGVSKLLAPLDTGSLAVRDPALYSPANPNIQTIFKMASNIEFYADVSARAVMRFEQGEGTGKRHDAINTFYVLLGASVNRNVTVPLEFERDEIQGGTLSIVCLWSSFSFPLAAARVEQRVLGENPPKPSIHAEIRRQAVAAGLGKRVNDLLAIAHAESGFHQFWTWWDGDKPPPENQGLPYKGPGTDWGIMQLNAVPYADSAKEGYRRFPGPTQQMLNGPPRPQMLWPPPSRQLWDWKANIAGGIAVYSAKLRDAVQHFDALLALAHRTDRDARLSERERRMEIIHRYNHGTLCWTGWDKQKKAWIRGPDHDYADKVMGVIDGIEAVPQKLPADWFVDKAPVANQ